MAKIGNSDKLRQPVHLGHGYFATYLHKIDELLVLQDYTHCSAIVDDVEDILMDCPQVGLTIARYWRL